MCYYRINHMNCIEFTSADYVRMQTIYCDVNNLQEEWHLRHVNQDTGTGQEYGTVKEFPCKILPSTVKQNKILQQTASTFKQSTTASETMA